ncbi:dNTP triphosphohydrolase [Aeromonas dhakensis]|uniref:dGTP triphosphohydrolase n=1 Tax=Aeromonas dhakensis TaxID=196024 RepID=UPI0021574110|nr:dNTP triphosphohydrolase [Aeromonas dhakensis]MCR6737868.1 dNTP triphosphohydrolase [Aeromonas dhakensis]
MNWDERIYLKVKGLYKNTSKDFNEILTHCDGAPPLEVLIQFKKIQNEPESSVPPITENWSSFHFNLPAPNPLYYQWWYTLSSQEKFTERLISDHGKFNALCIGTLTIAASLDAHGIDVKLLDIDRDVISIFNKMSPQDGHSEVYDVFEPLPETLSKKHDVTIIDPPWYQEHFYAFLTRAIHATKNSGLIYCSIPQILTRPNIQDERIELKNILNNLGHEVLYIEHSTFQYIIPEFEEASLSHLETQEFIQPWRYSDLLVIKVNGNNSLPIAPRNEPKTISYSINDSANVFRVFLKEIDITTGTGPREVTEFKKSISRRDSVDEVNIWTSKKDGFQFENIHIAKKILSSWASGSSLVDTIDKNREEIASIENIVQRYDDLLGLWSRHAHGKVRRSDIIIKEMNNKSLSEWATHPSDRERVSHSDGFRIEFQRDRDRIIWSSGFRKLADKTQLFPLGDDENLRQRLAHSIEVMQLATTISNSFGLNKDLVEAGALAHDIGHTPFGHAGENAIDRLFMALGIECGFNHYEHGVDVVRYLEGSYQKTSIETSYGLNLTPEVCDCILKHTFCHTGTSGSHQDVWKKSKHKNYLKCSGFSHLEGQAVRAADKISYLLSDIEDGIRLGSITHQDLMSCKLFHRPPIDFRMKSGDALYPKFIEQRGSIIKLLMEDIIIESAKRISSLTSINSVSSANDYCIYHSTQINSDMNEIWNKIQVKKLHKDPRVLTANLRAAKIVTELIILFTLYPEYIDSRFLKEHERLKTSNYISFYKQISRSISIPDNMVNFLPLNFMIGNNSNFLKSIDVYHLVLAKDYVASLSDNKCKSLHKSLIHD